MVPAPLKFSVVTPSHRQLEWLKLCVASVADQEEVEVEHLIQDAGTGPELIEWIQTHSRAKLFVEPDEGMYDAINRGFRKASGDIIAWLNCDEQYLPGALAKVAAFFESHPEVDVLFGDALLIGEAGELLSYRSAVLPSQLHLRLSHLATLSCATFFRRSVIERGFFLQTEWKSIADCIWILEMLKAGVSMALLPEPLAAYTLTRQNLSQTSMACAEGTRWKQATITPWMRLLLPFAVAFHRLKKLLHGAYTPRDVATRLYTLSSPAVRLPASARRLTFRWPRQGG